MRRVMMSGWTETRRGGLEIIYKSIFCCPMFETSFVFAGADKENNNLEVKLVQFLRF